jgi:hypothetical protein
MEGHRGDPGLHLRSINTVFVVGKVALGHYSPSKFTVLCN